jgi:hypothetical protein
LLASALAILVTATGCQGNPRPSSLTPDQVTSIAEIDRLLSSTLTPEEQALLINAHGSVAEACMQKRGWDFKVGVATPEIARGGPSPITTFEQWTFSDVRAAQDSGFDLRTYMQERAAYLDQVQAGGRAHIPDAKLMTPEEAERYELDYGGTDEERVEIIERDGSRTSVAGGGCLGEAERAVYGDIALELRLQDARTTADSEIWGRTLSSGDVTNALANWKGCVARGGETFEDPVDAFQAAVADAQGEDYEGERRVALLSAQCSVDSGLANAVRGAFLSAGASTIDELEDDLIALQQFEQEALSRAKDILKFGA